MKDIAHRDLDSSAAGLREREIPKRHPVLDGTRVRIYAVSFSRLGTRARNIDLRELWLLFLLSEMQNRSGQPVYSSIRVTF